MKLRMCYIIILAQQVRENFCLLSLTYNLIMYIFLFFF